FFFSSRRRHTRWPRDWSSDVCSSDLFVAAGVPKQAMSIYPGLGDIGAAVLKECPRSLIFGGTATVEQYKGNPRVQAHGPGFSKRSEERRVGKERRSQWDGVCENKIDD